MLALNDTKLFDECCGWLATWFTTPRLNATASSKNPRNCPIDIFTVRDEACERCWVSGWELQPMFAVSVV